MQQVVQILWTAPNFDEAKQISEDLVKERLVACAQILTEMESIYIWKDKLETAKEVQVCLKTTENHFSQIQEYIGQKCSYELPEILKLSVGGSKMYLKWVISNVK